MSNNPVDLASRHCKPCVDGISALSNAEIDALLGTLNGWAHRNGVITKTYRFRDYWQTMAFVNATAWVSHREDHHPELIVGYNTCRVDYSTHAIKGISENDFICAAKLDALFGS